jgi:hypothetical protein
MRPKSAEVCAFAAIFAVACSETTLETPKGHPADPSSAVKPTPGGPHVLASDFDPFVAYGGEKPDKPQQNHNHARPMPETKK